LEFRAAGYKFSDVQMISGSEFAKMRIGGRLRVVQGIGWLNVRESGSVRAKIIGRALPKQEFDFVAVSGDGWFKIKKDGKDFGWVFGKYVREI
jgi:hypothetical protein